MKKLALITLSLFITAASSSAWPALRIGDFLLGTPKDEIILILEQRFQLVTPTTGSRYQVPVQFYSAKSPIKEYLLGSINISKVDVFFNEKNHLNQVELTLETTDLDKVRKLIPEVEKSRLEPIFKDRWEIFLNEGEIIYYVGTLSGTTKISIADNPTSKINIASRGQSDLKFKGLSEKIDGLIDTMKK